MNPQHAAFEFAVRAVEAQNDALGESCTALAPVYRGEAPLPPRPARLSRLLDCEANGAHRCLEDFASAAKAIPRGMFPPPLLDELLASCTDLVEALEDTLENDSDCQGALYAVGQLETRVVNFLKGVSGAGEEMTTEQYPRRIDLFIADLKTSFTELGKALVRFEFRLSHGEPAGDPPQENAARHHRRHAPPYPREEDSTVLQRRDDTARVIAEIKRLHKEKNLSYLKAIATMRTSPVWRKRMAHRLDESWRSEAIKSRHPQR